MDCEDREGLAGFPGRTDGLELDGDATSRCIAIRGGGTLAMVKKAPNEANHE